MKIDDYRAMLASIEQALAICHESLGKMDEAHREICDDLREARDRVLKLLNVSAQGG